VRERERRMGRRRKEGGNGMTMKGRENVLVRAGRLTVKGCAKVMLE